MSGSEEFARFTPRIRDDMYLPDEHMTHDILASSARRKLGDIQRVGDINAEAARGPYDALTTGVHSFMQGREAQQKAEEQRQNLQKGEQDMARGKQQMELGDVALKRAQAQQSEEEGYRKFLDEPVGGVPGSSRRQQLNEAGFSEQINAPKYHQEEHELNMAHIKLQMRQTEAALGQYGYQAQDHKEAKARQNAQDAFAGIYTDKTLSPEQQDAKAGELEKSMGGGLVPAPVIGSYRIAAKNGAAASAQAGALQNQFLTQNTDTYQHMAQVTSKAQQDAQALQHLAQVKNTYQANLRFGGVVGGMSDEKPVAQAQRKDFSDTLDAMGQHDLAENVRSAGITTAGSRMSDALTALAGHTKASWEQEKRGIHPSMQQRPEIAQTDQIVAQLNSITAAGNDKNNIDLTNSGMGATSGAAANAAFLNNSGGHQGGMQLTGGAPPQGGGMVIPQGYNPQKTPAANATKKAGAMPGPQASIVPPGFQQAPPPGGAQPGGYPYDFSKYRVQQQTQAQGMNP